MSYSNYTVKINFSVSGSGNPDYDLPHVFHITDPKEGMKATIIKGTRGDGSIIIPGGKESQTITIRGNLFESDGYASLTTAMTTLKNNLTTDVATLTMKHLEGVSWITDWTYTVRRISEIRFPRSLRTGKQEYQVEFLVLAY